MSFLFKKSVFLANNANGPSLVIINCITVLSENKFVGFKRINKNQSNGDGRAIYCTNSSILVIHQSIFMENRALRYGGAVYCTDCFTLIINGTLLKNTARNGGALYISQTNDVSNDFRSHDISHWTTYYYTENITTFKQWHMLCIESNFTNNSASSYGGVLYSGE